MTSKPVPKASFYLGFLLLLNVFNFAHRQMPISLGYQIEQGLAIDHAQLGLLIGYAFIVLYSVAGMIFGTVADRWNRPRLIALGLALWSSATLLSGATDSFLQITLARLLVGMGAAVLTPTALGMLSDVYDPEKRAFASGVYYGGIPLGAGLSLIIVALLEPVLGWRACFYVMGGAGLLFVPLVLFLKDPIRGGAEASARKQAPAQPETGRSTLQVLGEIVSVARWRSPGCRWSAASPSPRPVCTAASSSWLPASSATPSAAGSPTSVTAAGRVAGCGTWPSPSS
jgi:predicted MFS family arabinose efflux permease